MQQPSLTKYALYIMEREGSFLVENEFGWASYGFQGEFCEIRDMWIAPEFRIQGKGTAIVEEIINEAKKAGFKKLCTKVCTNTNGAEVSLKAQLAYGFHLAGATDNTIFLVKEI